MTRWHYCWNGRSELMHNKTTLGAVWIIPASRTHPQAWRGGIWPSHWASQRFDTEDEAKSWVEVQCLEVILP